MALRIPSTARSSVSPLVTSSLPLGINLISAKYSGDTNYTSAVSSRAPRHPDPHYHAIAHRLRQFSRDRALLSLQELRRLKRRQWADRNSSVHRQRHEHRQRRSHSAVDKRNYYHLVPSGTSQATYVAGDTDYASSGAVTASQPRSRLQCFLRSARRQRHRSRREGNHSRDGKRPEWLHRLRQFHRLFNLPSESTCSFSSATVAPGQTMTLTVLTAAPSSLVPASRHTDFAGWRTTAGAIRLSLLCFALFALAMQARRRRWNLAGAGLLFTLLLANAACGGGGGGAPAPPIPARLSSKIRPSP